MIMSLQFMKRKICALILSICFVLSMFPPIQAYAATTLNADFNNGVVNITLGNASNGTAKLVLYDDGAAVYQGSAEVTGGDTAQIALPVRNLSNKDYSASITFTDNDGNVIGPLSITLNTGVSEPVTTSTQGETIGVNTPRMSRAIMQPYAKVYNSSSMTGTPLVELKRHDFVQVIRDYGNVAYVKYFVQSGNGTYEYQDGYNDDSGNHVASGVIYSSDDDLTGMGYIYTNSFDLPLTSEETDVAREAVELAYSRLGTNGVYNQMRRYIEYYTDCSAFVSYCYYNAGIDFGSDTTCNGISSWANEQSDNVILWDGGINRFAGVIALGDHAASEHADEDGNVPSLTLHTSTDTGLNLSNLISYRRTIDSSVISEIEAGDILFFNHKQTVYDQFGCNLGSWQVLEANEGLDHVGIVVGVKGNTVTIIESTPSSSNPQNGVIMSTKSLSDLQTVAKIVRPTGCEEIDPIDEFDYSGSNLSSSEGAKVVYSFLTGELGLNSAAACGVMASIQCESGFLADIQEYGSGIGYGLCQWSFGRRTSLVNWCQNNGYDYTSYEGQLFYLAHELENSYSSVLNKLRSVDNTADGAYQAGYDWCRYFEVPKNYLVQAVTRGNLAQNEFWPQYGT